MTHEQLMERHKTKSELSDLTAEEREVYDAFLELAETRKDEHILSTAWLRMHRRAVLARG
jgi:prophage maintenance system killer protein